ncbi:MAG: hypothetical protein Ta2B_17330 [Termitinemataceae bacterium]|nr:MAG: hypothetical protein Ta2B_17330 [Termitinemataceae bacterium]
MCLPTHRIEKQITQNVNEALKEPDTTCACGCKKNSNGNTYFWKGYKLHLDISDLGFSLNAVITGTNVHDSLKISVEEFIQKGTKVSILFY